MRNKRKSQAECEIILMNRIFNRDLDLNMSPPNFADSLSEKARAKGLQRDDYRIKALIENGKVMTKDHEGNIKTITLRENEALIFVEIYDDSDWLYFQKQIKEEENKKK